MSRWFWSVKPISYCISLTSALCLNQVSLLAWEASPIMWHFLGNQKAVHNTSDMCDCRNNFVYDRELNLNRALKLILFVSGARSETVSSASVNSLCLDLIAVTLLVVDITQPSDQLFKRPGKNINEWGHKDAFSKKTCPPYKKRLMVETKSPSHSRSMTRHVTSPTAV